MTHTYDIIIIGGGAAGMMAAISARRHHPDKSIAIIDRTFALGRKILVCGAGRCNITNINLHQSIETHYYGANDDFIHKVFNQFGFDDIVTFFNDLGVELYVERKTNIGKMFPVTNQAQTITELMLDEIERNSIDVHLNTEVTKIKIENLKFKIQTFTTDKAENPGQVETFEAQYVILSAGGKSYPALGSNGTGYNIAQDLGHSIIEPVPAALPLEAKSQLIHKLQGQKLEIEATSIIDGKEVKTASDDVMFTKYGLSGPAILNISREISLQLNRYKKNNCKVKLNFFPGVTREKVQEFLEDRWSKRATQTLEKSLFGLFPNKVARAILEVANINPELEVRSISEAQKQSLISQLTNTQITIQGTRGWNEAEFTAGGIDTKDVKTETLESALVENLYICGEILDVDGDVGGFNLSWSWASGFVAGKLT